LKLNDYLLIKTTTFLSTIKNSLVLKMTKTKKKVEDKLSNESEKLPKEGLEKPNVFQKGLEKSKTRNTKKRHNEAN